MEPRIVIIRTRSAGVHFGEIVSESQDGKRVTLRNARRIWSWRGANTLNEIALRGVGDGSKISEPVPEITLTEASEIIVCQLEAIENLARAGWRRD
jgi:hypothetical protein